MKGLIPLVWVGVELLPGRLLGQAGRAEGIVGQAIEALGGRAALERVRTRYARGRSRC